MLCAQEISGWATKLLESLDDTTTPTGIVSSWLYSNLGALNLRLEEEFYVSGECIEPPMSMVVSGIYSEIFYCQYWVKMANKNLAASAWDWVEIAGDREGVIRKVSKNEVAKTYRGLANDCRSSLDELSDWYLQNKNPIIPTQTLMSSRFGGSNFDLLPPPQCYCPHNFIFNS